MIRPATVALLALLDACGGVRPPAPASPSTPSPSSTATRVEPLKAAAAPARLVGAAVQASLLRTEPDYAAAVAHHFNYLTAEFEMKWGQIERQPGQRDYGRADEIAAFAEARGTRIKGHALVWHGDSPAWLESLSPPEARIALEDHIRTTVGRYRGRISAWDVVNEAIADDRSGLRDTVYLRKLGPGYIAEAFRRAHEADPEALLIYNDYGAEGLGRKSDEVYNLLRDLRAGRAGRRRRTADAPRRGQPSGGGRHRPQHAPSGRAGAAREHQRDGRARGAPARHRRREARRPEARLPRRGGGLRGRAALPRRHLLGLHRPLLWIDRFFGPDDPLLFDESYQAKPAYYGVMDALRGR